MFDNTFTYDNIEAGIKPVVKYLRDNDVMTLSSCEGHDGSEPYVQIGNRKLTYVDEQIQELLRLMRPVCSDFEIIYIVGYKDAGVQYGGLTIYLKAPFNERH